MADYKVVITKNGLEKLEYAMATGERLIVSEMALGDAFAEPYSPNINQVALKNEIFRTPLVEKVVLNGEIKYKAMILSTDPSGDFIELGLYLSDGTLFALANIPKLEHRQSGSGAVTETEVSVIMVAENADHIEIPVVSQSYVTKEYADTAYLRTDGVNSPQSGINMAMNTFTNMAPGSDPNDAAIVAQTDKIGSIKLWAGVITPEYWLDCDHASYSRIGDKADLYAVIGTLYGTGDDNLSFNVPHLENLVPGTPLRYIIKYK